MIMHVRKVVHAPKLGLGLMMLFKCASVAKVFRSSYDTRYWYIVAVHLLYVPNLSVETSAILGVSGTIGTWSQIGAGGDGNDVHHQCLCEWRVIRGGTNADARACDLMIIKMNHFH